MSSLPDGRPQRRIGLLGLALMFVSVISCAGLAKQAWVYAHEAAADAASVAKATSVDDAVKGADSAAMKAKNAGQLADQARGTSEAKDALDASLAARKAAISARAASVDKFAVSSSLERTEPPPQLLRTRDAQRAADSAIAAIRSVTDTRYWQLLKSIACADFDYYLHYNRTPSTDEMQELLAEQLIHVLVGQPARTRLQAAANSFRDAITSARSMSDLGRNVAVEIVCYYPD